MLHKCSRLRLEDRGISDEADLDYLWRLWCSRNRLRVVKRDKAIPLIMAGRLCGVGPLRLIEDYLVWQDWDGNSYMHPNTVIRAAKVWNEKTLRQTRKFSRRVGD